MEIPHPGIILTSLGMLTSFLPGRSEKLGTENKSKTTNLTDLSPVICKFSRGRLAFPVPVKHCWWAPSPFPSLGTKEGGVGQQHGTAWSSSCGKKAASCPETLRPACHKGQLLPSHLQKRDPNQSIHRANTVRYPPTHHQ